MGGFLSSLIFPGKAHVWIWQWKYKFTITKVWKVIFESEKMSSIWRPVDFDSLGSTAVQEGENSVISISDEEEQAEYQYDTSASDGEQKYIWYIHI